MVNSMDRWKGKVAVVTGASVGIGSAIAECLLEAGVHVVGIARRKELLDELVEKFENKPGRFYPFKADVTKEENILEAFKWIRENLGPVHILINNAGVLKNTNLIEGNTSMWKELMNTNVLGLCVATREAIKDMRVNNVNGHIVHINSISGHKVVYFPNSNLYPASKYAVTALTETLRQELNSIGSKIKITSISPGAVRTAIHDTYAMVDDQEILDNLKNIPYLEPIDVASVVLYTLGTPSNVQIHEIVIKPVGSPF